MNKNELITKLDLTFIITIFVGISYVLAYIHHIGMFAYYGIPFGFLDIDVKEVLYAMFTLLPLILGLIWGLIMKSETNKNEESLIKLFTEPFQQRKKIKRERKENKKELRNLDAVTEKIQSVKTGNKISNREILLGEDIFLQNEYKIYNKLIIKNLFILFLLLGFLGFIFSAVVLLFYFMSTNNLQFTMILINSVIVPVAFYMKEKINYKILFTFILLFLLVYSFGNGWEHAENKENYITFENNEEVFIVLTTYKNQFLYAPINENTRKIEREFSIINMEDIDHFSVETIKN